MANDPPPVGGLPTTDITGFDDTAPAGFGVGLEAGGAGFLMMLMLDLPAPFACANAFPANATQTTRAVPRTITLLFMCSPSCTRIETREEPSKRSFGE